MPEEIEENNRTREWLESEQKRLDGLREELAKASAMLRLETERMKREETEIAQSRDRFEKEKEEFRVQMHDWTEKIRQEREKLSQEQGFFDKKFKILEMGFQKLDADRKVFEARKRAYEYSRFQEEDDSFRSLTDAPSASEDMFFFRGVTHPLALKKRYKDLIKIYHPDNLCGDKTMLQQINREYEHLKKVITYQKKA